MTLAAIPSKAPVPADPVLPAEQFITKHTVSLLQRRLWEDQLLGHRISRQAKTGAKQKGGIK